MSTLSTPTRGVGEPSTTGWRAVSWRPVAVFLAVAFGGAWGLWLVVIASSYDLGSGLYGTDAGTGSLVMSALSMMTPTLGVLIAVRVSRRQALPRAGLGLRPYGLVLRYCLIALALYTALYLGTLAVGQATGFYTFDLAGLSGMRESLDVAPGEAVLGAAVAHALILFVAGMPLIIGEEVGWRGYLEPQLEPLGLVRMILFSGFIWGVWHLPAVFLADRDPGLYLVAYLVDCTVTGGLLCWLRIRSGSIWPAIFGHAAISSFPGPVIAIWLSDASQPYDIYAVDSLGGWISWILKAVLLVSLGLLGWFRPWRPRVRTKPGPVAASG